jgi:predicted HicB family RNase H-like nuclease
MKNEKLKLMLNKVVEYNNPKAYDGKGCHFKAFLYKIHRGYYFKVVEIFAGTDVAFNDIIYLKEGDEEFLVVADKPKLMRVSRKSWHYRLLKYVLRDNAPTPKDMQNGCPYFWLLLFSMGIVSFILIFKAIKWVIFLIPKALFWVLEQIVMSWIAGLDDEVAYEFENNGVYGRTKMPTTAKIFFENSNNDFFGLFLAKKYKIDENDPKYVEKQEEIKAKWKAWREKCDKKREEQRKRTRERETKRYEKQKIHDQKREEVRLRWETRMKPINEGFDNFSNWFYKTFTVERGRRNMIVKRTKQFVGLIVTLIILTATFFAVNYIALVLMVIADFCISNWIIFVVIGFVVIGCGILYLLYVLISSWGQNIVNRYKRGKKVWYIESLIYLVWYPVKYLAIVIAFIVTKIIWLILKIIFYTLIFKYFVKPISLFVAKLVVGLVKSIGSSSGIFGEYFGASYSDYCPGIEWVDFEDEH